MRKLVRLFTNLRCRIFPGAVSSEHRLPSLVRALREIAPASVLKEVVSSSNDRRQWGILAAAWIGVSEKELMRAAAERLRLEFRERVPEFDTSVLSHDPRELLMELRACGAVPVLDGDSVREIIAVDPAEIRECRLYDGTQEISLACWSEICKAQDSVIRTLEDREAQQESEAAKKKEVLVERVLQIILDEVTAHGAQSVDILSADGQARYQFSTPDGRKGYGSVHPSVLSSIVIYLRRVDGKVINLAARTSIFVHALGSGASFRLMWNSELDSLHDSVNDESQLLLPTESAHSEAGENRNNVEQFPMIPAEEGSCDPILVVDDNPMFSRVLERLLKREGYAPYFTESGASGLDHLDSRRETIPSAIVCDLHMPVMNGKEFVTELRRNPRFAAIPVIMLTSDDDLEVEVSLLSGGADAFISKSKDPRILCAQLRRLIQRSRLKDAA